MVFRSPPPHRRSSGSVGNKLTKGGKPNRYTPRTNNPRSVRITNAEYQAPVTAHEVTAAVLAALVEKFGGREVTWQEATAGLADAAFQIKALALAEIGKRET